MSKITGSQIQTPGDATKYLDGTGAFTTPSGGGGGSSYPPAVIDDPANFGTDLGYDYEFNSSGSTLPTGWSWLNQGTSTYNEQYGAGTVSVPGGTAVRGITRALPTAPFTMTLKLTNTSWGGTYNKAGLLLTDGTNVCAFWQTNGGPPQIAVEKLSLSAFVSSYLAWIASGWMPAYLQVVYTSATNVTFKISDGCGFTTVLSGASLGFTPTAVGFGADPENSKATTIACHWFRVR